jgi:hypothetical protein
VSDPRGVSVGLIVLVSKTPRGQAVSLHFLIILIILPRFGFEPDKLHFIIIDISSGKRVSWSIRKSCCFMSNMLS